MTTKDLQETKHKMLMGLESEEDIKAVFSHIERLQGKLDKAVEDITDIVSNDIEPCDICDTKRNCHKMASCPERKYFNFKWRGEETE